MNYKNLLKKYMQYVIDIEGIDYIEFPPSHSDIVFTEEELEELNKISAKIHKELK